MLIGVSAGFVAGVTVEVVIVVGAAVVVVVVLGAGG
jgi:hypothetical protein